MYLKKLRKYLKQENFTLKSFFQIIFGYKYKVIISVFYLWQGHFYSAQSLCVQAIIQSNFIFLQKVKDGLFLQFQTPSDAFFLSKSTYLLDSSGIFPCCSWKRKVIIKLFNMRYSV